MQNLSDQAGEYGVTPQPQGGLIQGSDGNFYGMTPGSYFGGGYGKIIKMSPQGQITTLHSFYSTYTDGYFPQGNLVQGSDGNFYGVTAYGGAFYGGTIFEITPGGQYSIIYNINTAYSGNTSEPALGAPTGGLVEGTDGNLYGTTGPVFSAGGGTNNGNIFKIPLGGGLLTVLHTFGDGSVSNDGNQPSPGLIQGADGNFYGTTEYGGSHSKGVVFKMTMVGTVTIIHNFGDGSVADDGLNPTAGLIQSTDGNLYGTTTAGGTGNAGTIFKITTQGVLTLLHSFADGSVSSDGTAPGSALLLGPDGNFYGTTPTGGSAQFGTIFESTPQGKFSVLHNFGDGTVANDALDPQSALILGSDGNLYGTSQKGGAGQGSIYNVSLNLPALTSLPPQQDGIEGTAFSYSVTASHSPTNYAEQGLPSGLGINATTGLINGTPTTPGTYTATLTFTNAFGSSTALLTLTIDSPPPPTITSVYNAYGTTGTLFTYTPATLFSPTSFTATGLPSTLLINPTTGVISGTPTAVGTYSVSITPSNGAGPGNPFPLTIQIFSGAPTFNQEYVIVHSFNDGSVTSDGQNPSLIFQGFDGTLYGATEAGGTGTNGSVFNLTTQGATSILADLGPSASTVVNSSTMRTTEGLVQGSDGNFYGTAQNVGASTGGYFYRLSLQGQVTILHHFGDGTVPNDGTSPSPGLIQGLNGNFYGTTEFGGKAGEGCVYMITTEGVVTILHSFNDGTVTNDGQYPTAGLIQDPTGNLYGVTSSGGSPTANAGTVFMITNAGSYSILHSFGDGSVTNDGGEPAASLIEGSDGNFYGTTEVGGALDSGCVFRMTASGSVTILHSFGDGTVVNDGDTPEAPLIQGYDGNFYGVTTLGGEAGQGTIFTITSGGSLTIIHSFGDGTVTGDGAYPTSIFQATDGNFYGTTQVGGYGTGYGTVFAILAAQTPTHAPIFLGSAYAASALNAPFSYTPKAEFGVSGSGANNTAVVQAQSTNGNIFKTALAYFFPEIVHKNTGETNWVLYQGTTPATMLPNYLTFDSTTGTISGTPVESGTFTVSIQANNAAGTGTPQTLTLYINVPPIITSSSTAGGSAQTAFTYTITANASPSYFGATGLPGWLTVNTLNGQISGTPPAGGTFVFNAVAENYAGTSAQPVTLTVTGGSPGAPVITGSKSISGSTSTPLSYQIVASNSPTAYSALTLPVGLTCNPTTGLISGMVTTAGTYSVPITVTNASGMTATELTFAITGPTPPILRAPAMISTYVGNAFSYVLPVTGSVSLYQATGLPSGVSINPESGVISGTPLGTGTSIVTVDATNSVGTSSATFNLVVNSATPVSYDGWATINGVGAPSDTPLNDGVPNILKFLTDINPNTAIGATDRAALPTVGFDTTSNPGTTYLTLTYRQYLLATGQTVGLQTSTDLKNWTTVTPQINQQIGVDPLTSDPIMEQGVSVNGISREFIRLEVILP